MGSILDIERNKITILLKESVSISSVLAKRHGLLSIDINAINISEATLSMLEKDLTELSEKWECRSKENWHPTLCAYSDFLKKMSQELRLHV